MSPPETPSPSVEAADAGKVDTALELLVHREVARAERILATEEVVAVLAPVAPGAAYSQESDWES